MFIVREGNVSVSQPVTTLRDRAVTVAGSPAAEETVAVLGAGAVFGETALIERRPRNATVTCAAQTGCVLDALDAEAFHALLRRMKKE